MNFLYGKAEKGNNQPHLAFTLLFLFI